MQSQFSLSTLSLFFPKTDSLPAVRSSLPFHHSKLLQLSFALIDDELSPISRRGITYFLCFSANLLLVGWGNTPTEPSFGGARDDAASVKGKLVNLISSVRTLMRSECLHRLEQLFGADMLCNSTAHSDQHIGHSLRTCSRLKRLYLRRQKPNAYGLIAQAMQRREFWSSAMAIVY